jgi:hypothetical protein
MADSDYARVSGREWTQSKEIAALRGRQELLEHRVAALNYWVEALSNSIRLLQVCMSACRSDCTKTTEKETVERRPR